MADQDFNITIRTIADTTGIKLTQQGLDSLKIAALQGNQQAITALKQLTAAQKEAQSVAGAGFGGSALGVGTIIGLLGTVITKYKAFEDEQDKIIEKMTKAREKTYELGLEVADTLEAMQSMERIDTEPLESSFRRLTGDVIRLKTELKLAFESGQYEDAKRLIAQLRVVESQVDRVTSAIDREKRKTDEAAASAEKLAAANEKAAASFLKGAVETSSPQTQAVLRNEEAARKAREAGDEKSAGQFQKTADQLKASMSQSDREEYEGLTKPIRLGPKAQPGESQDIIDQIARNKINFDRQLKGEPPLPPQGEAGGAAGNQALIDAIHELRDLWK